LRSGAQDLHKSISDASAKRSGATKAEIAALSEKAKAVAQSTKASIDVEQGNAAKHLTDAVTHLEATQAQLSDLEGDKLNCLSSVNILITKGTGSNHERNRNCDFSGPATSFGCT
jgi:hypothetical protein